MIAPNKNLSTAADLPESDRRRLRSEVSVMLFSCIIVVATAAAIALPLVRQLEGEFRSTIPVIMQLILIIGIVGMYVWFLFRGGRPPLSEFVIRSIAALAGILLSLLVPVIWDALPGLFS